MEERLSHSVSLHPSQRVFPWVLPRPEDMGLSQRTAVAPPVILELRQRALVWAGLLSGAPTRRTSHFLTSSVYKLYFAILRRPPFLYLLARGLLSAGGEEAEGSGRGREGGTASLGTQGDWVQCLLSSSLLQSCSSLILCWGLLGQQRTEV